MNKKLSAKQITDIYVEAINFNIFHKIFFLFASLSVGFWFLCPIIFKNDLPTEVLLIVFPIILLWLIITLPRHFMAMQKDDRLYELWWNPILSTRSSILALKPTNLERERYPWIMMVYYFALIVPFVCLFILLVISLLNVQSS